MVKLGMVDPVALLSLYMYILCILYIYVCMCVYIYIYIYIVRTCLVARMLVLIRMRSVCIQLNTNAFSGLVKRAQLL